MTSVVHYPEVLLSKLRFQLLIMRFELLGAAEDSSLEMPPDIWSVFVGLSALDHQIVAAQKARGYSDTALLKEIRRIALERKDKPPCSDSST